jgi:hypothetical protein
MGLFEVTRIMSFNEILKKHSYLIERDHFKDMGVDGGVILK